MEEPIGYGSLVSIEPLGLLLETRVDWCIELLQIVRFGTLKDTRKEKGTKMYTQQDLERLTYNELCQLMEKNRRVFHAKELAIKLIDISNMVGKREIEFGSLFIRVPKEYGTLSMWYSDPNYSNSEEYSILVLQVTLVSDYDDEGEYDYIPNFDIAFVSLLNDDIIAQVEHLYSELLLYKKEERERVENENKKSLIYKIFRKELGNG